MSTEEEASSSTMKRKLSCTTFFDALWFCYSPVHQMQQYYRLGSLDNCKGKWKALVDCLLLKTKPSSQLQMRLRQRFHNFNCHGCRITSCDRHGVNYHRIILPKKNGDVAYWFRPRPLPFCCG